MSEQANMAARYEREIPEGYEARIEGNKILERKESEDEKIRKQLIGFFSGHYALCKINIDDAIAYLERQKEQPEVDSLIRLELPDMEDDKSLGLCYCNQFGNHRMTSKDVREIARHFYELGLSARKEEQK